ncbi:tripartite motif-containing protein 16-like [Odontesthes bonariensis]|uniref:tripartite motif-containing protein 16-like n=1 Tax=Odontesthes bonariensis TaxID=219752 RepID=UPI003F58B404
MEEIAKKMVKLDLESFSCSICLDVLKEPVTIPCGHSYCMNCIKGYWNGKNKKGIHSCPQCMNTFTPRPILEKSTMLADLVEQLKKTGLQAAPADLCYAGAEDVACDFCSGRKLKAIKSCLFCLASYCEEHLQPHYDVAPFRKHKLVEPSKKLQENICSVHDEVMKMFCRTDQKSICYLCSVDEHKGHDTVSAAAERTERQRELEGSRQQIQQRIQDREKDVKLLQQEVEAINQSADKTVEDSQKIFTELIRLIQKRSSDVKQQIRSQQEAEGSRVKELQEKLEQEITELKRKDAELKQLSHTEDHSQFLHNYPSVSALSESTHSPSINIRPLRHFEDVTAAVSELRDKLQDILREEWRNSLMRVTDVDILLPEPEPEPEPKSRADFLKYSCEITLDPNTANTYLLLSEGNRKVTLMTQPQSYSDHPDRFRDRFQVLSRESLTGRCYWEVEMRGGGADVAVTYKNISRAGDEGGFGFNDKSWALDCYKNQYEFWYNNMKTSISGPQSSRVGVYLDHRAGVLSFYSVSETMTLLHRVQTTFTQPLYAGVYVYDTGDTAEFCERLTEHGLIINPAKCEFGRSTIDFLGHRVTKDGVVPLPSKVEAITTFPRPVTFRAIEEFLGMVNFYHRFLPRAAQTMHPLYEALKGVKPKHTVDWKPERDKAFVDAKTALAKAAMLAHPASSAPIALTTDASDYAVGAVYEQWSLSHGPAGKKRQLTYISEFTTDIAHLSGKHNQVADCLSRAVAGAVHLGLDYGSMATEQATDPDVQACRSSATGLQLQDVAFDDAGTTLLCDISMGSPRPVVPAKWRRPVFDAIHSLSHPGTKASQRLVAAKFVWHGLKKDVRDWANTCVECMGVISAWI